MVGLNPDRGYGAALPRRCLRNCVDHPADCNLFKKYNPIKFAIIRPLTLNYNKIFMKLLRNARRDNLFNSFFFSVIAP